LLRRQGRSGSWATRRWRGFFVDRDGDRRQAPSLLSPYILETESFLCQNSPFEAPLHFLQKCSARCCPGISVTFCAPEHFLFSFVRLRRTSSDLGTQRTRGRAAGGFRSSHSEGESLLFRQRSARMRGLPPPVILLAAH
jgi:hypothetical protein